MNFEISNLTNEEIDNKIIGRVLDEITKKLDVEESLVSIVLVDDKRIHEINRIYRNVDRSTDVISFAFLDEDTNPSGELINLGEIYISLETAHKQAIDYGHSFIRELSFLVVHGILHLLGYDHMEKDDEIEMFSLQDEILSSLNIER